MKKIVAVTLSVLLCALTLCSCAKGKEEADSSQISKTESVYSEVTTESSKTESKKPPKKETSSKKTESVTQSESVKRSISPADALSIGMFHFSPYWSQNYKENARKGLREFRDVIEEGYANTVILSMDELLVDEVWNICIKNNVSVWLSCYGYLGCYEKDFDKWMAPFYKTLNKLKENPERWKRFCGFVHEENIWRGQSNALFLKETEALYKAFGKRNFPVFATGEFTGYEGNQNQINMDAANMKKINPKALKYVTDTAFDSYSVDVRYGYDNGGYIDEVSRDYPDIYDGETYYEEYTRVMLDLYDHDVNVWFYPCAYTTGLWSGLRADESYCLAHLNFFNDLLAEQDYQGGLILYTYQQFSNPQELGLQSHLIVKNDEGKQELRPNEEKWNYYSFRLKELVKEYKNTKAKHIGKI